MGFSRKSKTLIIGIFFLPGNDKFGAILHYISRRRYLWHIPTTWNCKLVILIQIKWLQTHGYKIYTQFKKKLSFWPPKSGQNTHFFVLWCCNIIYIAHNCYFWKDNAPTIQKMQTFLKSALPERRYWNLTIFGTCPNRGLKTINCRLLRHLASTDKIFAVQKFFLNFPKFCLIFSSRNIYFWLNRPLLVI